MKKGFIVGAVTGLTIAGASLVFANSQIQAILNDQIKVTLNGQVQEFRDETSNEIQYPITYHDRTYLPLRTVANLVGVDVDYNSSTNTAILKSGNYNEYIFPTSDKIELKQDLSNMSKDELELAKNEIFARYGYDFSVKAFQDYFETKSWYNKISGKKVSVSELNSIEQKNVAYIDKYITTKSTSNEENKYALVERLVKELLLNEPQSFFGILNTTINTNNITINDIEICTDNYVDTMLENQVEGQYYFQKNDLASGNVDILGTITCTLDTKDITGGEYAGGGPIYSYKNYSIYKRGFHVSKVNGEYKISLGEG